MKDTRVLQNNLIIGADYIAFTIRDSYSLEEAMDIVGLPREYFKRMPNGSNGYRRMLKCDNISVLYDGTEGMGTHFNITGSSVSLLLEFHQRSYGLINPLGNPNEIMHNYVLSSLCQHVLSHGHFTRIDISIDDIGAHYYSIDDIVDRLNKGKVVSLWRNVQNYNSKSISDNLKNGHTLYFGSRESDISMRIYDKRLERNKNISEDDERYIRTNWIRWELEAHRGRADKIAHCISEDHFLGEVALGVLSKYFRIINLDDTNKSRCSSEILWEQFVENIKPLKITSVKEDKTLDEEMKQWVHQNGRKFCKYMHYIGGDSQRLVDLALNFECKLTLSDKEQLGIA